MGTLRSKCINATSDWSRQDTTEMLDYVCAIILALVPILQHYRSVLYNAALTLLVVLVPYLLVRAYFSVKGTDIKTILKRISPVLIMVGYFVYRVVDHGTSVEEFGQSGVLALYLLTAALGCIKIDKMCKAATMVSIAASLCLIVQYISFYLFEHHIQLVPTSLLLPMADQWILGAQTGLAGITGRLSDFYRPSAFFLEPSHLYIYAFPHLLLSLFGGKATKKRLTVSILISLGMILCTSGMGMAVVVGAWVLFFALYDEKSGTFALRNVFCRRNLLLIGIMLVAAVLAFLFIPSVNRTVTRIFVTKTGTTAITGRISKALESLKDLTITQWIFGVQDTTHNISYNVPGLIGALLRHGLIGMLLSVELYIVGLFKGELPYKLVAAVVLITSIFSAHTHSTIGMLYYMLILLGDRKILAKDLVSD